MIQTLFLADKLEELALQAVTVLDGKGPLYLPIAKRASYTPAVATSVLPTVDSIAGLSGCGRTNSLLGGIHTTGLATAIHVFPALPHCRPSFTSKLLQL